ncbi:MAG: hypothetical protein BGO69_00750 [Bacteroidetes bacterium 46-16]|nr:MAG: hypothetical protein BGO69_00750 [Bacteroidetes bacterium 46-16]
MRKSYLFYKVAVVALLALAFQSCKKNQGVDNNNEVETPYSLYYSDSAGNLFHTNSGDVQDTIIFPADGYPSRALYVLDSNILWIKRGMFYSKNNGTNFNPTYLETGHLPNEFSYNQSMLLHAKDQGRVYICTDDGHGVAYSEESGNPGTWKNDNDWDGNINNLGQVTISSLTQLDNGVIIGYDLLHNRTFAKDNANGQWHETTNTNAADQLPDTSSWTVWHMSNTVIAIDSTRYNGLYFSDNNGNTWTHVNPAQSPGLDTTRCFFVSVIYNQVLLGTEKGVYRLQGSTFLPSNNGVEKDVRVRGFAAKEIVYKTGEVKQYVYMTCSKGLYRSVDQGHNWEKVRGGNLINIW